MLVLSNSNDQTLLPGQSATFNLVVLHTGCAECYRPNSGAVNLAGRGSVYEVSFSGNVGTEVAGEQAQLAISLDNSPLLETTMISTMVAVGDLNNVATGTFVKTCCCPAANAITVVNTGSTTVNLAANPALRIKRNA